MMGAFSSDDSQTTSQGQLSWVTEQPGNKRKTEISLYAETGIRTRRFHRKSKNGCKGCKRRRVKCDESTPACGQCAEKQIECEYPEGAAPVQINQATTDSITSQPILRQGITSNPSIAGPILAILVASNSPCEHLANPGTYRRTHALELVDHFAGCKDIWLGSPLCQKIMQQHVVPLCLDAPYLLHALLAVSAAHMASRFPDDKKYFIASTLHYHLSLGTYSAAITHGLQSNCADAIFGASILHAMLAFIKSPKESEGLSLDMDMSPSWIMSWQGVKTLLNTPELRMRLQDGIWQPIIELYEEWENRRLRDVNRSTPSSKIGACTIGALKELCLDGMPTRVKEIEAATDRLDVLFHLDVTLDDIDGFVSFMANIAPACIGRLRQEDEKALLILCYWCALFGQFDQWWIAPSAKLECTRICEYLDKSSDPRVHALLMFPAHMCGYELKDKI